jgi:thiamine monophosphate synthase
VAVVSAICASPDPENTSRKISEIINSIPERWV